MRTIKKRATPARLVSWRQERIAKKDPEAYPFDYDAMRRDAEVLEAVEESLLHEQGGICAYTGRRIALEGSREGQVGFHLEHLKPQDHCELGEDCNYRNLVACWPEPNQTKGTPYGAVLKDNWPEPEEAHLFVTPLRDDCTRRFTFSIKADEATDGKPPSKTVWIEPAQANDAAAGQTIAKLQLNHSELRALRWDAVRGALHPPGIAYLKLSELEKLAKQMDKAESDLDNGMSVKLDAFCFAVRQALARLILKRQAAAQKK
jgi:uncharacterized protein (TIGR02646 family)